MSLFANLAALTQKDVTVQITVQQASDGLLEVNLIPTAKQGTTLNLVPRSFIGTPEELDTEFAEIIAGYARANLTLKQQLEDLEMVAAEAAKQASKEAADKAAKKTAARSVAPATAARADDKGTQKSSPVPTLLEDDQDAAEDEQDSGDASPSEAGKSQTLPLDL